MGVNTAFLFAELIEAEDGATVVMPPALLFRLGLVNAGVLWKLQKALCGLICAPKRWGVARDDVLNIQLVNLGEHNATMEQCKTTKGLWKLKLKNEAVGYRMVSADDVCSCRHQRG